MAHEVFISHSSEDKATADLVCAALEDAGMSCWIAPRDVRPGRFFPGEIKRAIEHCRVMVLIFSAHSNHSVHVLREIDFATRAHARIVNFRIEKVAVSDDLDYFLALPHWLDALTPPTQACLAQLTGSVHSLLELPVRGTVPPAGPADSSAPSAVFVAPEPPMTPAASGRAVLHRKQRELARPFTDAALREAVGVGFRAVDDFQLLEPLIRVLARAGDESGALRAAVETGGGFRDFALGLIAETQVRDGDPAGARRTAAGCQETGDAFCRMARALSEAGDVAGALRTVAEGSGRRRSRRSIPGWAHCPGSPQRRPGPGDVAGALRTAASIGADSPNPTQQKEARRRRESARAHIAEAQAQAGDAAGAAHTVAAIEDARVRRRAQNKVHVARARGGDIPGALAAVGEGRYDGKDWVLGCIAEAQAQADDPDGAARTVAAIDEDYRRDQALAALAVGRARGGDLPSASGMAKEIGDTRVRKKTQARIFLAQAEAGNPTPAIDFVQTLPTPRDRIKMAVAFASLLLDDPARTRWWMDFASHPLWD